MLSHRKPPELLTMYLTLDVLTCEPALSVDIDPIHLSFVLAVREAQFVDLVRVRVLPSKLLQPAKHEDFL